MRRLSLGILCVVCLAWAGAAWVAEEGGVDKEAIKLQMDEAKKRMRDVQQELGKFKREIYKDPEVAELKKAMDEARKAFETKVNEKLEANAEAKPLMTEMAELRNKLKDLQKQMRPPRKPRKPKGEGGKKKGGKKKGGEPEPAMEE